MSKSKKQVEKQKVAVRASAKKPRKAKAADGAAARRRVMRKIEARRNRSNREVAVGAAEYLLTAARLCGASLVAARNCAENAVETLKELSLIHI